MPRVFTAKAGKDYPDHDIKKGDTYFYWSFFRGRKQMSKTMPKRSQTTGSSKLANVYAAEESLQDALNSAACLDDVIGALDQAISDAESCVDEYNEAIDNLNEGFPNGCPQIDETEQARDTIESWKDELESAKSEVEGLDANNYIDEDERKEETKAELEEELSRVPTDEEVQARFDLLSIDGWDDLHGDEQEAMLSDAQDTANAISLEL